MLSKKKVLKEEEQEVMQNKSILYHITKCLRRSEFGSEKINSISFQLAHLHAI